MIITIKKAGPHGGLDAWKDNVFLFRFEYRKEDDSWYFWLRGDYDPDIFPCKEKPVKNFPFDYFYNACSSVHFIKTSEMDRGIIVDSLQKIFKSIK